MHLAWRAFDEALDVKDGLVLRFGAMMLIIPDAALTDDLSRTQLKTRVEAFAQ